MTVTAGPSTNTNKATVVGVVGAAGAYGQWLCRFFAEQMQCRVIGVDPALSGSPSPAALTAQADVLVFSAPIRPTPAIIAEYTAVAGARSRDQLWLDVTSLKQPAVDAMLQSEAEVVGLHPMCAAPKTRTLRDRVLVVCEARLTRWRPWVNTLLQALDAETVYCSPTEHDQVMALVQGMIHAGHFTQAQVLSQQPVALAQLAALMPFRSPSFTLDMAVMARILTSNPAIYEDIQFLNPYLPSVLDGLAEAITTMANQIRDGSSKARDAWRSQNLTTPLRVLGGDELQRGHRRFEALAYLLADLDEPNVVVMHLPRDEPGQLQRLLAAFAEHGINLNSLHSSRDTEGNVHFRLGLDRRMDAPAVQAALAALSASGIAVPVIV